MLTKTLDASMLNIPHDPRVLAPLCRRHGIAAVSATRALLEDPRAAQEAAAIFRENGVAFGLMPMPADFYSWELDGGAFDAALKTLALHAAAAEKLGIRHAYNHVWSSGPRAYDENFDWHVRRVRAVTNILEAHGIRYGLEFLGPHELLSMQAHPFVHTLDGVLAIADAAGGYAGVVFDTFHWYCSTNGDRDTLLYMEQHADRLVLLHVNDGVPGVPFDRQHDLERRLPMETGVIDSRAVFRRLNTKGCGALCMIEPFEPGRTHFHALTPEAAVREAAALFARLG
ncbi:MAG: sugar phosphate isomerase/epimerase family protein [Acutalibacteraceae bacterium]